MKKPKVSKEARILKKELEILSDSAFLAIKEIIVSTFLTGLAYGLKKNIEKKK